MSQSNEQQYYHPKIKIEINFFKGFNRSGLVIFRPRVWKKMKLD
jgi:hypothetical protein